MIGKLKSWASSATDRWQDRRLGIHTEGLIVPDDIGDGCFAYLPIGYRNLDRMFAQFDMKPGHDVFIDYGSGLGRVPLYAAMRPFKRVIGVELSKKLNDQAIQNAKAALPKLVCKNVDMVECDARAFAIPADATVFYFFMPFDESILGPVLDTIKASVDAHPRDVTILYVKPVSGAIFIDAAVAAARPWLRVEAPRLLSSNLKFWRASIQKLH